MSNTGRQTDRQTDRQFNNDPQYKTVTGHMCYSDRLMLKLDVKTKVHVVSSVGNHNTQIALVGADQFSRDAE